MLSISKRGRFAIIGLACAFVSACHIVWSGSAGEWFGRYTEAAIEWHRFSNPVNMPVIKENDKPLIYSEKDYVITLYIRNPQKFTLETSVKTGEADYSRLPESDRPRAVQGPFDILTLTLPNAFLQAYDLGTDISPAVSIKTRANGTEMRFGYYSLPLQVRSRPPKLEKYGVEKQVIVVRDDESPSGPKNTEEEKWVVAFDMPSYDAVEYVNSSISKLEITGGPNNKTWTFTVTSPTSPSDSFVFVPPISDKPPTGFTGASDKQFYLETGDDAGSGSASSYTIKLIENDEFTSTVTAESN